MKQKLKRFFEGISTYDKKVRLPAIGVNCSFLAIHVLLLVIFSAYHVTPMVYFNICSVCFYIGAFFLIRCRRLVLFVVLVYLEVLAHMFMAALCVGWDAGFQVTLIGITSMLFYAEYVGRVMDFKYVRALPMAVGSMAAYLLAYGMTESFPPGYEFPHEVVYLLGLMWAVITFVIVIIFLLIFCLISSMSENDLNERVAHDELTGLFSRHFMTDYLDRLLNESERDRYWLAIADIDDFKMVNDTYGHNYGDYVLRTVAGIFRDTLMSSEVCRWGGEEFLILGKNREEEADLHGVQPVVLETLERVRAAVAEQAFVHEGQPLRITITIGVAPYREGETRDHWIDRADTCLYQGKCQGKNQVVTEEL